MKKEKITIFLSHSHKDQEKVRKIRDILESLECEPLIFFLKCLDDKNAQLEQFIKEEIEARNIFVYCKSRHSEKSTWVKKELEYIKSFDEKRIYTIDIENDFSLSLISFLQTLANILKRNRIFISHSNYDRRTCELIRNCLEKNGYQVQNTDRLFNLRRDLEAQIRNAIDTAVREGIYMFICSSESIKSKWCLFELEYALSIRHDKESIIIPIIIDDGNGIYDTWPNLPDFFQDRIAHIIHRQPTEAELQTLVDQLNSLSSDSI